jgi:hypothetical protein
MSPQQRTIKSALDTPEGPLRARLVQKGPWRTTVFSLYDDRTIVESRTPIGEDRFIHLHREMAEDHVRVHRVGWGWWLAAAGCLLIAASMFEERKSGHRAAEVGFAAAAVVLAVEGWRRTGSVIAIPGALGGLVFQPSNPSREEVEKFVETCVDAIRRNHVDVREVMEQAAVESARFDPVMELFRFQDLLDRGIITRDEFDAAAAALAGTGRRRIGFGN